MSKCLLLTDGKQGHENQTRALARILQLDPDIVKIEYKSKWHKALSYLFSHLGIRTLSLFKPFTIPDQSTNQYRIVLGTGSGTFYATQVIAKRFKIKCCVILNPSGYRKQDFDCIFAPAIDRVSPANNIVTIPVNLVANDKSFYEKASQEFLQKHPFDTTHKRAVAVILGGPNKCATLTASWLKDKLEDIFATRTADTEFWVTTSRRTPKEVDELIKTMPFDYKLINSEDSYNPVPAFVNLADELYVTAESTSMLSEACTFGHATVNVLDNLNPGKSKYRDFATLCAKLGAKKIDLSETIATARKILGL